MSNADCRTRAARLAEDLGLVDVPADPEDENRWQEPDCEEGAPSDRLGQKGVECRIDQRRGAPPHGPAGLYDADAAAAILVADDLTHQHGTGRPFAAEAQPVQRPQHEEL